MADQKLHAHIRSIDAELARLKHAVGYIEGDEEELSERHDDAPEIEPTTVGRGRKRRPAMAFKKSAAADDEVE